MIQNSQIVALLLLWIGLATRVQADIIMHVDAANQEFWFTGTDTGSPGDNSGIKEVSWRLVSNFAGGNLDSASFATDFSFVNNAPAYESYAFHSTGPVNYVVSLTARFDTFNNMTIHANGAHFGYGTFNQDKKNILASLAGSGGSIPVDFGVGFSAIQIMGITAVPEPSSAMLLSIAGLGFLIRRPRRFSEQ